MSLSDGVALVMCWFVFGVFDFDWFTGLWVRLLMCWFTFVWVWLVLTCRLLVGVTDWYNTDLGFILCVCGLMRGSFGCM